MTAVAAPDTLLTCRSISTAAELENLRDEWEELLRDSAADEVTLAPDWMLTWHGVFGSLGDRRLVAAEFRDATGRLAGLTPFVSRIVRHRGLVPLRRLEPLGAGEPEADSICTEYAGIPARRGQERAVAAALARALTKDTVFGSFDELHMPRMAGDQPMTTILADALRQAGLRVTIETTDQAPYVPLPATWEEYLQALPGDSRYFVRRSLRDFEAWADGPVVLERARTQEELERGTGILIDLHRGRWEQEGPEAGAFRSERFLAFHVKLMDKLLARGELELAWLTVGGRPVAATYSFIRGGKVSHYQSGRILVEPEKVRPGIAIFLYLIRDHIAAGRREFDFLAGDVRYKRQLARATRPVVDLRAVRPSLREGARRAIEWCVSKTRRWRKRRS